jgi:DNA-directed RNA polymerase specialized sigma subunit
MKRTKFPPKKKDQSIPINLIRSIAWTFYKTTKVNWDELFSEACLAYCESIRKYDPTKGSRSTTWVFIAIKNALINFCKRETRMRSIPHIEEWHVLKEDPLHEFFASHNVTSEDARIIVNMVLQDHFRYALKPKKAIRLIKQDLQHNLGWPVNRVQAGILSLQEELLKSKRTICIISQ